MKYLTLILYVLLTVVLAVTTLVEHTWGTDFVVEHIYHSVPFIVLWGVLGVLMIFSLLRKKIFQVGAKIFLHLSFIIILAGALTTFLTSKKGMMHLRMGEPSFQFVEEGTRRVLNLPFILELDTFYIDCYPGTDAPADYVSVVKIETQASSNSPKGGENRAAGNDATSPLWEDREGLVLSMNNILSHEGYRFYQSSFDEDRRGTWLSVNYDPWGTGITYAGYIMLLVAMVWMMIHPRGGFRQLLRKITLFTILFVFADGAFAQETKPLSIISLDEANGIREMQVIYHDRVVPLNTLARDFVKKIYGKESFSGLTPEQILLSWQRNPEEWAYVPAIKIKSDELRAYLGIEGEYARMVDFYEFDKVTTYKLAFIMRERALSTRQSVNSSTDYRPSPLQKAVVEADEKVALIRMLQNGTLIRPLPEDGSVPSLSRAKVKAELLYNRIPFTKILFMFNLTMGILLLVTGYKLRATSRSYLSLVACSSLLVAMAFALTGYLLRWYIGGRIPLSNGYETMLFLALCIMGCALIMKERLPMAIPFGFLLSGFTLLVAYWGEMNPQITPLMPVLVSPWLSLHVSVIMMSYALFAFILLNGVWALLVPREAERLMLYGRLMLYPAVFLLAAGIFMGAVWANVSWGRYWGWDPKEVWALITLLIYALPLHGASLPVFRKPKFFHAYLILSFLNVLMTYFGVNFFLGGMHSYA